MASSIHGGVSVGRDLCLGRAHRWRVFTFCRGAAIDPRPFDGALENTQKAVCVPGDMAAAPLSKYNHCMFPGRFPNKASRQAHLEYFNTRRDVKTV